MSRSDGSPAVSTRAILSILTRHPLDRLQIEHQFHADAGRLHVLVYDFHLGTAACHYLLPGIERRYALGRLAFGDQLFGAANQLVEGRVSDNVGVDASALAHLGGNAEAADARRQQTHRLLQVANLPLPDFIVAAEQRRRNAAQKLGRDLREPVRILPAAKEIVQQLACVGLGKRRRKNTFDDSPCNLGPKSVNRRQPGLSQQRKRLHL